MNKSIALLSVVGMGLAACAANAQTITAPFAANYSYTDLGSVPGLPAQYGGVTMLRGDNNTLLIGGRANTGNGAFYTVGVTRDGNGHITGFGGPAQFFGGGEYNDGGVAYQESTGILFASRWPVNQLGMMRPGSNTTDKVIDLGPLGVEGSNASLAFVPGNMPGAGQLKISSWSGGQWGTLTLTSDGTGLYDAAAYTEAPDSRLPGGPEGWAYVPLNSPVFGTTPTMILSEYSAGQVSVYQLDANGDPIVASRQLFMEGLAGAEGALIDPLTGDFIFSTFGGGDRVIVVSGFNIPAPGAAVMLGLGGLVVSRRRRHA